MAPPAVLIVDDEAELCDNLAAFLDDEGMLVHTAGSAETAIAAVRDGLRVDVCIMDLRLPGMNGAEAIVAIHELAPQTAFIVHTGSPCDGVLDKLQRHGLQRVPVFRKPLGDMGALAAGVRELCAPAQRRPG